MISIADLIVAVKRLDADGATPREIALILGLVPDTSLDVPGRGTRVRPRAVVPEPAPAVRPEELAPSVEQDDDGLEPGSARPVLPSDFFPIASEAFNSFVTEPLPQEIGPQERLPFDPLLLPGWSRAVLSAALSTVAYDGAIEIEAIIPRIATKSPIKWIPRLPRPTMRRGVQLLIDRGPALAPFARDQEWLVEQVRLVAGIDRVEVFEFFTCPTRGGPLDETGEPTSYTPPAMGTVVLAMTDLGIGRPPGWTEWAAESEWLDIAMRLRKAGCPFLALVPYSERRWPTMLASRFKILPFDRRTAASTVRRLVPGGHGVER
jgi:hypothetical protein